MTHKGWCPEGLFLLRSVTPASAQAGAVAIRRLAREADPARTIELASFHGVIPLVARRLRTAANGLIPELQNPLGQAAAAIARRNLLLTAALVQIIRSFNKEDIPAVAFKGPMLALDLYGDVGLRPFLDLDILVPHADVARSARLITAAGYEPGPSGGRSPRWLQRHGQRPFYRSDGARIDLHWQVLPTYFTPGTFADKNVPRTIALGGTTIRTLSPEALFPQLCLHGTKHVWNQLKWIADIARFVAKYSDLDWDRLLHGARAAGAERMILAALWLARDLLDTELPAATVHRANNDRVVAELGRQVSASLFTKHGGSSGFWPRWRFNMRARERLADKARCGLRLISAVGFSDLPTAARLLIPSAREADRSSSR